MSDIKYMFLFIILIKLGLTACGGQDTEPPPGPPEAEADPAQIALGERLFLETRFAQFFSAHAQDVNASLPQGDPVMESTQTRGAPLPGPFAGQSMNCAACHLVDQQLETAGGGMRAYSDFARRSPVPARLDRGDPHVLAVRNAQPLVGSAVRRAGSFLLHFDGEFVDLSALVKATLTGRNYGWLPDEQAQAIRHIARVIREDDGNGALAQEFGGAYRTLLTGTRPDLPAQWVLPEAFRIDVDQASDTELVDAVARLIAAYVEDLAFSSDDDGVFNGSPYDAFLAANGLPTGPAPGEADAAYADRLAAALEQLTAPVFITGHDAGQRLRFHDQPFRFAAAELRGLRLFLRRQADQKGAEPGAGNCVACHAPPHFTDFQVHNTGASQEEYDGIHGAGRFLALSIPGLSQRAADHDAYLPATARHPRANGRFRAIADAHDAARTDLGVWNVFANPDFPAAQARLRDLLRRGAGDNAGDAVLLERAVAAFKTPGLRDLGHSAPYMHNGKFDTLRSVVEFYRDMAELARRRQLRNPDPELAKIVLQEQDVADLSAFLEALNEDYE